jgi:hypothetical protein
MRCSAGAHEDRGESLPLTASRGLAVPLLRGGAPQRPGWHAESTERTLPASAKPVRDARVLAPALHSCSARRARRRLAPRPARTPPRRPVAARVLFCGAASGAAASGSAPGALRSGFRPASSTLRVPCSRFPAKSPLRLHPRSRRRAGFQRGAPLRGNPSQGAVRCPIPFRPKPSVASRFSYR